MGFYPRLASVFSFLLVQTVGTEEVSLFATHASSLGGKCYLPYMSSRFDSAVMIDR